VSGEVLTYIS